VTKARPFLVLGLVALVACHPGGSASTSPQPGHPSPAPGSTGLVLTVTRVHAEQGSVESGREWTFRDPTRVSDVLAQIRALPKFPTGIFACPMQFPVSYRLVFSRGSTTILTATVSPTGCETVTLDPGGNRRASKAFLRELHRMLGLSAQRFTGRPA
jgi:hypothetical protein